MHVFYQKEIREIDQQAEQQGFSLFSLMENAGRGLAEKIEPLLKADDRIIILCGRGNNGGDGIVIARYLLQAGFSVSICFPLGDPTAKAAKQHLHYFKEQKHRTEDWNRNRNPDVIIDALLGIGITLPLRENTRDVIDWCNSTDALKIAIDLPTGVLADRGEVGEGGAFMADVTFALHGAKPSAFLLPSSTYYGKMETVSIGLKQKSGIEVIQRKRVAETLPKRPFASHKGSFGTSMLIAGSDEMPGSALLAATGAIRSGTGKLIIGTTKFAASVIAPVVPEATYVWNGLEKAARGELPEKIATIGIGPGIADEKLVTEALRVFMQLDLPLVIDAGALLKRESWAAKGPVILTPHPGEFSRLTGMAVADIQANRIELAREFSNEHQAILVLKGNDTVIAFPDGEVFINPTGNSGLAKGGSGDVLTGMIVSMLATHEYAKDAVINAVYVHGLCAEKWSETKSEASMAASDFATLLPIVLKDLESLENQKLFSLDT